WQSRFRLCAWVFSPAESARIRPNPASVSHLCPTDAARGLLRPTSLRRPTAWSSLSSPPPATPFSVRSSRPGISAHASPTFPIRSSLGVLPRRSARPLDPAPTSTSGPDPTPPALWYVRRRAGGVGSGTPSFITLQQGSAGGRYGRQSVAKSVAPADAIGPAI